MSRWVVEIVPLEFADRELLFALSSEITRVFSLECRIDATAQLPANALDEKRGQYHATRILEHLAASNATPFRLLGITAVDVFTPILRYVFGEAMLGGRAALVSTYRLGVAPPRGDHSCSRPVFMSRILKEGIHELGHTFGLTHCDDPVCAMAPSLDMKHVDAKSMQLCYYCKVMLADELQKPHQGS